MLKAKLVADVAAKNLNAVLRRKCVLLRKEVGKGLEAAPVKVDVDVPKLDVVERVRPHVILTPTVILV